MPCELRCQLALDLVCWHLAHRLIGPEIPSVELVQTGTLDLSALHRGAARTTRQETR